MKLVIFGATGTVGRKLVEQALEQGHVVTAFVRNRAGLEMQHPNLRVAEGDVLDPRSVAGAVEGQEAVLCALGAGRRGGVRAEGTRNILDAMNATGVNRLVCQSTLGVGASWRNLTFFWKRIMFGFFLKDAFSDHVEQECYVRKADADWTIVRPGAFTDGERTGQYRHGFAPNARGLTLKISRADVADFMLKQLTDDTYLRQCPGLSY